MSIVQIFDQTAPLISGYSMRSKYITDSLTRLGVDIEVFSSPTFQYDAMEERIGDVPYLRSSIPCWRMARKVPFLRERLIVDAISRTVSSRWGSHIKLIDAHSSLLNGMAASKLAAKHKVPFIYEIRAFWEDAAVDQGKTTEEGLRYKLTRRLEMKVIKKADKVTVICEGLKNELISRGIDEDHITVIPNGVDIDYFQPLDPNEEIVAKHGLQNNTVFGFIGTFFDFEGLDLLINAAKEISLERSNVKFLIIGGGRSELVLKELVRRNNVEDHVLLPGRVNHEEVKKYYSVMDHLVYPRISKRITELVTPLKPLEAMAMKKSVIASDVGGLKELIEDGVDGILFKAGDQSDLVEKCLYAIDHPREMQRIGAQARRNVVQSRNWLSICELYLPILERFGISSA